MMLLSFLFKANAQVTVTGENKTDERFNIRVVVKNDTILSKDKCKRGYVIKLNYEHEFTLVFSSGQNTHIVKVYASDRELWFNIDIDLTTNNDQTMVWDPNQGKYLILDKIGADAVTN